MNLSLVDLVYSSAVSGQTSPTGILYPSLSAVQKDQFVQHQTIVFLPSLERVEIQRAAQQKIPCMVSVHSLQNAFEVFKHSNVKFVHVPFSDKPIIDVGWMGKAREDNFRTVVFSIPEWKETVYQNKTRVLEEYLKLVRLLVKWKIPVLFASFAKDEREIPTQEERASLHVFFGMGKKEKAREIYSASEK